jgi:hypothetical protein
VSKDRRESLIEVKHALEAQAPAGAAADPFEAELSAANGSSAQGRDEGSAGAAAAVAPPAASE